MVNFRTLAHLLNRSYSLVYLHDLNNLQEAISGCWDCAEIAWID